MKRIMKNKLLSLTYILYPTVICITGHFLAELYNSFLNFEIETVQFFILKYICPAVLSCVLLCLILVIQWKLREYRYYKWIVSVVYIIGVVIASIVYCKSESFLMVVVLYGSPISEMIILMFLFIFVANIMIYCLEKKLHEKQI